LAIEYLGDYFHGNPLSYNDDEIVCISKTAKNAHNAWLRKQNAYLNMGYNVLYIWERDFNALSPSQIKSFASYMIGKIE